MSVGLFVGDRVKTVRVALRPESKLTPGEVRDKLRKVWRGRFWDASCEMRWAEMTLWNIAASIEFEDGGRSSITTDGLSHVAIQDREGKVWYLRLIQE